MKITNTNTSFLMFLAYLIFTEFEILIMYCCCRPRLTSLFPKKALNKWIFRWKINKDSFLFFVIFSLFSPSVLLFVLTFFSLLFIYFYFFGGGGRWVGWRSEGKGDSGTLWVVSTSGLLPDILQWEINNWGGGGDIHHYSSLYISKANLTSRSECDFQTLILTFTISWRAVLSFIVLRIELVHLYTDNLSCVDPEVDRGSRPPPPPGIHKYCWFL